MKRFRWPLAGFVVGACLALAPGCGPLALGKKCNVSNCTGCCDATGTCQLGTAPTACGKSAADCHACAAGNTCSATGACTQAGSGGGTGGGATGGSATGGSATGGSPTGGGSGSCASGCFSGGQCMFPPNNAFDSSCGIGGVQCQDCLATGATCSNNACVGGSGGGGGTGGGTGGGGTGGGTGAVVGTPCTSPSQCASLGSGATCKLSTANGHAYPQGFCTVGCPTGSCPGSAVCTGMTGSFPALYGDTASFCVPSCTTQGATCAITDFTCYQNIGDLNSSAGPMGCWLDLNSSSLPPFIGGGSPNKLGQACSSNPGCGNPPDPALALCYPGTLPDGGPSGFTGGYCMADCNLDNVGTFCGSGGLCLNVFGTTSQPNFACLASCSTPGGGRLSTSSTARDYKYVCRTVRFTDGGVAGGYKWPACNAPGFACASPGYTVCVTSTGYCCSSSAGTSCRN